MILFLATKHVDLSPPTRIKPALLHWKLLSLSHWTCREVPRRPWVLLLSCRLRSGPAGSAPSLLPGSASPLQRLSVLLCPLCSVAIVPVFLYATAVQTSCTHYIFSSGPSRVLIIFLRRTLCYSSPWHLQCWVTGACPQSIDWWDYTLPCSIAFPCPLHWLAVQHWSCVCSIRHNLYLFYSFWRVHANF